MHLVCGGDIHCILGSDPRSGVSLVNLLFIVLAVFGSAGWSCRDSWAMRFALSLFKNLIDNDSGRFGIVAAAVHH